MEKDRSSRLLAILAMVIAVGGLSLGFAAFSNTLVIQPQALVTVDESTFNVELSSTNNTVTRGSVSGSTSGTADAEAATISNDSGTSTISNLNATFKNPGDQVSYQFYAVNTGEFDAYLKSITFDDVDESSKTITCNAKSGTTQSLVDNACKGIEISVLVGNENFISSTAATDFTDSGKHRIAQGTAGNYSSETVTVTLKYNNNASYADGDFDVKFGDISLVYSSVPND